MIAVVLPSLDRVVVDEREVHTPTRIFSRYTPAAESAPAPKRAPLAPEALQPGRLTRGSTAYASLEIEVRMAIASLYLTEDENAVERLPRMRAALAAGVSELADIHRQVDLLHELDAENALRLAPRERCRHDDELHVWSSGDGHWRCCGCDEVIDRGGEP